ncbi:EH signature domain-containing protein [Coralloluteibacterium stylophorae]|uniref:Zorya protein ZorC EH domain-containing protein n=2 Tax=Coralloluteibacterium stylophorae TaxID=1776034 RepID=A0AAP2C9X2_9GAMM|nr:hypothetical protein [Coralloluteibacterium stylophorae]
MFQRQLAPALGRLAEGAFRGGLAAPSQLAGAAARLRDEVGRQPSKAMTEPFLDIAIERLAAHGADALRPRDDLVLAAGLGSSRPQLQGRSVAAEPSLLPVLLQRWRGRIDDPMLGSLLWRSVFLAYFHADDEMQRDGMRRFLTATLASLEMAPAAPGWLQTVLRHRAVLGDSPAGLYAEAWIDGDDVGLRELSDDADLPEESWFWGEFVGEVVAALCGLRDSALLAHLDRGIDLAMRHPQHADSILAALLERVAASDSPRPHEGLLQCLLEAWGNPQLELSDRAHRWSQVSSEARRLVCRWLAEDDLKDFFALIKSSRELDDDYDTRRFDYWKRFTGQMSYTKLILGPSLRTSTHPDVRRFIGKRRGRLGWLTGTTSDNMAILMKIGNWWFVEFGQTGNACYPYRDDLKPFDLSRISLDHRAQLANRHAVKASGFETTMVHRGDWEERFDATLARVDIWPDGVARGRAAQQRRVAAPRIVEIGNGASSLALPERIADELEHIRRTDVDNRQRGGRLWVEVWKRPSPELIGEMTKAGFRFANPRGFYR